MSGFPADPDLRSWAEKAPSVVMGPPAAGVTPSRRAASLPAARPLDALLFVGLAVLALWQIATAAFWRDELQAWLIARSAPLPWDIWPALRYEGHPPLFYLVLWPLAHLGLPPESAKLIVGLVALGALALLIFHTSLSRLERLAVGISGVWAGAYLAQPYALLPLLLLGAHALDPDGRTRGTRRLAAWTCLGAVGATDLFGLLVAGLLGLRRLRRGAGGWVGPLLAAGITGLGLLAAFPAPDAQSIHAYQVGINPVSALRLVGALVDAMQVTAFLPFAVLAALGLTVATLSGERLILWLLALLGTGMLAIFSGAGSLLQAVSLLVLWVILRDEETGLAGRPLTLASRWHPAAAAVGLVGAAGILLGLLIRAPLLAIPVSLSFLIAAFWSVRRWPRPVAAGVFAAILVVVGVTGLDMNMTQPLSVAPAVAKIAAARLPPQVVYLATPDWLGSIFSAELNVPVWTPECACEIGPIRWTRARNTASGDPTALRAALLAEAQRRLAAGQTVALVLAADDSPPLPADLVVSRSGGQWADEDAAVWLVRPPDGIP